MKVRATMTVESDGSNGTISHALGLEGLAETVAVIRHGLEHYAPPQGMRADVRKALNGWCDEIEKQLGNVPEAEPTTPSMTDADTPDSEPDSEPVESEPPSE